MIQPGQTDGVTCCVEGQPSQCPSQHCAFYNNGWIRVSGFEARGLVSVLFMAGRVLGASASSCLSEDAFAPISNRLES